MHYDAAIKKLLEIGNIGFLRRIMHSRATRVNMLRELPQETTSLRSTDFPMEVEEGGGSPYILLLEIQTEWRQDKAYVLAEYYIRFVRKYFGAKIRPCMVLLRPNRNANPRLRLEYLTFQFDLIKMWELEAAEFRDAEPEILPLLPLMRNGLGFVDFAERRLYHARNLTRENKADLLFILALLTGLINREESENLFQKRRDIMTESALYEIIKEEGKQEGIAEGKREGIAEGKREGIAEGKQEGIAEGKQEGIAEGKREDARKMLARGYSLADIQDITGLSLEELRE